MATKIGFHQQHGRRVLLWTAIFYGIANLVIVGMIDGYWKELRSAYLVDTFHQLQRCPPGKPDVVCIGTSRLSMAFSVEETQWLMQYMTGEYDLEVFNASTGAQDLITADYIMEQMLARGARPALAVIEIGPDLLARHDIWLGNHVMPPAPTSSNLSTYLGDLCRASFNAPGLIADRAYPLSRCRREIWTVIGDISEDRCNLGLRPAEHDQYLRRACAKRLITPEELQAQRDSAYRMFLDTNQAQQRKERVAEGLETQRNWLRNYEVGGLTCQALDRLLQRCAQHRVRVLLVAPPVASEQRAIYTPEIEVVFQNCLQQYLRKYDCRYVDCRDYVPDACFTDNHHVCIPEGSAPFSRRLTEELLVPEWRARQRAFGQPTGAEKAAVPDWGY